MLHPFLHDKLPEIKNILMHHHVTSAYAFGSVCTDSFNENSDVDLLVNLDDELDPVVRGGLLWNVWDALEKILNRKVDLLTERSLTNPYFIEELNEKKILLYGKKN